MKEISIEEKAKRFDEAIERAKNTIEVNQTIPDIVECVESLFPELKKSEDDNIRRWIINEIKIKHHNLDEDNVDFVDKAIAWLEKKSDYHKGFRDGYNSAIHEEKPLKWTKHDELVRKEAISCLKHWKNCIPTTWNKDYENILMWLENDLSVHTKKQKSVAEIVERCKNAWYNEGKIQGQIEGLTDEEKYQQGWHDALEKQDSYYTKRDVDDAYLKGVIDTRNEIEKQYKANYQIRKDIATFIFNYKGDIKDRAKWMDYLGIDFSFVEKQGEQKPQGKSALEAIKEEKVDNANKVEPKFHEGDWIVDMEDRELFYVSKVLDSTYELVASANDGDDYHMPHYTVDDNYRLWTINDAKDGDVLYLQKDGKEHIIIYKGVLKERFMTFVSAYCAYNGIVDAFCFADVSKYVDIAYGGIMPAAKEQRDQLEKAMADAGYTFDFEKKELKRIEQKPAWSEDDKNILDAITYTVKNSGYKHCIGVSNEMMITFIKSLKDRVQPQSNWKPSDKQIKALDTAIRCGTQLGILGTWEEESLKELIVQLKKLREE